MRCPKKFRLLRAGTTAAALSLMGLSYAAPIKVDGPVTITATTAEWVNGVGVYSGNVLMQSKTMELRGERLEFSQPGGRKGAFVIPLTGSPATLHHEGTGKEDPTVDAEGKKVVYRSASRDIQLSGNAKLTRGKDVLTGEAVTYNTATRGVKADGSARKQVRMVIDLQEQGGSE